MPIFVKFQFSEDIFGNSSYGKLPLQLLADGKVISSTIMNRDGVAIFPTESVDAPLTIRVDTKSHDQINKNEDAITEKNYFDGVPITDQTINLQANATITVHLSNLHVAPKIFKKK